MTSDVSRVQGAYKIQSSNGTDIFVVDTTNGDYQTPSVPTTSKVVITGDLFVIGSRTQSSSTFVSLTDPTLLLNQGDTFAPKPGGGYVAGLQISRSDNDSQYSSAFMQWNEAGIWHGTGALGAETGIFEFRVGPSSYSSGLYSAIKVNAIRMPKYDGSEGAYSTVGGNKPRLNIFGSDNPNAVLSVSGTTDYASNVTDDDDIPNKKYVDNTLASGINNAENLVDGRSYLTIIDQQLNGVPSEIVGVLDGSPVDKSGIIGGTVTGTVVMRISSSVAQFSGIQLIQNQIQPVGANTNLILTTNGTGQILLQAPLLFQSSTTPVPGSGQTGLYTNNPGGGGTGVYYVNSSTGGVITNDEFVSRKKALVFSLIF